MLRAIRSDETQLTSSGNIVRDYFEPGDFYRLVSLILESPATNNVVDCYTQAPVDKMANTEERFGLRYEACNAPAGVNATGVKMNSFRRIDGRKCLGI
jgi:hypothetical protein